VTAITLLLLSVLSNTLSQLSLKRGVSMLAVGGGGQAAWRRLAPAVTNAFILGWLLLLIPSMVLWLVAISMVDLSFAYPFLSLNMVLISAGSAAWLKERVPLRHWVGLALIVLGILLVTTSQTPVPVRP
jgi:drug/metabolite transporter (DMT)-like permease